jgi:hypothetical protein
MKKITLMLLVAMVPFLTMAQKRSKKNKEVKTERVKPIPNINSKASSFTLDRDTRIITEAVIDKLDCPKEDLFCGRLMKLAGKQPIIFETTDEAPKEKPSINSRLSSYVSGVLLVGKNEYKADLFFDVRATDEVTSFYGNLVIEGSLLELKESKVMITVKGMQK